MWSNHRCVETFPIAFGIRGNRQHYLFRTLWKRSVFFSDAKLFPPSRRRSYKAIYAIAFWINSGLHSLTYALEPGIVCRVARAKRGSCFSRFQAYTLNENVVKYIHLQSYSLPCPSSWRKRLIRVTFFAPPMKDFLTFLAVKKDHCFIPYKLTFVNNIITINSNTITIMIKCLDQINHHISIKARVT